MLIYRWLVRTLERGNESDFMEKVEVIEDD